MTCELSKASDRGRLVIPARIRRKLGIRKGTHVAFLEDGLRMILQPITPEYIHSLRGSLKEKISEVDQYITERKTVSSKRGASHGRAAGGK